MGFTLKTWLGRPIVALAPLAISCCLPGLAGDRAPIRPQIQFSNPAEPAASPTARPRDDLPPRPFEFLNDGNSISGVVAPFVGPTPAAFPRTPRNARLFEAVDQKKNWVYVRSEDVNRSQTADEVFGVRDPNGAGDKPRTTLEKFFDDRGQKPLRDRNRDSREARSRSTAIGDFQSSFDRDGHSATNVIARYNNPLDSTRPLTAGFSFPSSGWGSPQDQGRSDDLRKMTPGESLSGMPGAQTRGDDFRKLLAVPGSANPLVPAIDPINLGMDATRRELNPVTAQRAGEFPAVGGDALNPLRSVPTSASDHPNLLDGLGARTLGTSSLSPAVSAPAEFPLLQPKPTVLEFPRRKF